MRPLQLDAGPVFPPVPAPAAPPLAVPARRHRRVRARPGWRWVPWAAYAVAVGLTLLIGRGTVGPWALGDELLYRLGAEALWQGAYPSPQYPPLYSLAISPALLAGEGFYGAILLVNALLSASVVFPVAALAQRWLDEPRSRLLVTVTALAAPFHVVFPRMVMSENLYLPLLVWLVYLLTEARLRGRWPLGLSAGAVLGLCMLTRHISLVLVPVLLAALLLPTPPRPLWGRLRPGVALAGAAGAGLVYAPWLLLSSALGFPLRQTLGLHISTESAIPDPAAADLGLWALRYLAYGCVAAAPLLPLLLLALRRPGVLDRHRWELIGVTTAVSLALAVAATRHSWLVVYNTPVPLRIMGRYVAYLGVPWLVVAATVLERLPRARLTRRQVVGSLVAAAALAGAGWALLYLPAPHGIVTVVNGADVWAMVETGLLWAALAALAVAAVVVAARGRAPRALFRAWLPAVLALTVAGTAATHVHNTLLEDPHDRARHTVVLAEVLAAQPVVSPEAVVSYDLPATFGDGHVHSGIRFWGAREGSYRVQRVDATAVATLRGDGDDVLVVPVELPGLERLRSYRVDGVAYHVYRPEPLDTPG